MQENIEQPPGDLIIDGRKWYSEKSLKYNGTTELCAWSAWWPQGHLHWNFRTIYERLIICLWNAQLSNQN
jgi:hypothetical protein